MVMNSSIQCQVSFTLGNEEYGLPSNSISSIIPVPEINKLPHTADYLLGIIKVKGTIIPIIDLKKKLTGVSTHMTTDCRIIIMEIGYSQVGMLVEKFGGSIDCECSELEPLGEIESEVPDNYLLGITRSGHNIIKMLNNEALLG